MPNWCENYVRVLHQDPAMMQKFADAAKDGTIASTFVPEIPFPDKEGPDHLSPTQYSWRVDNWGTKWDFGIDDLRTDHDGSLTGYCETAWAPPVGIWYTLHNLGFKVYAYWHESGMCFAGQFIEGTHDEHHDIDYSEECLSNLPPELVDMFSMESYSDYEEETETEEEEDET
jgi:hypothetical protein